MIEGSVQKTLLKQQCFYSQEKPFSSLFSEKISDIFCWTISNQLLGKKNSEAVFDVGAFR